MASKTAKRRTVDYLRRGGFEVYDFGDKSMAQVRKIMKQNKRKINKQNQVNEKISPSTLSQQENLDLNLDNFEFNLQSQKMIEKDRSQANGMRETVKKMINRSKLASEQVRNNKYSKSKRSIESSLFKQAISNLINSSRNLRQQNDIIVTQKKNRKIKTLSLSKKTNWNRKETKTNHQQNQPNLGIGFQFQEQYETGAFNHSSKSLRSNKDKSLIIQQKNMNSIKKVNKEKQTTSKTVIIKKSKKMVQKPIKKAAKVRNNNPNSQNYFSEFDFESQNTSSTTLIHHKKSQPIPVQPSINRHKSVKASQISLSEPLKKNNLYYASRMVYYDHPRQQLKLAGNKQFREFVEQTVKSTAVCKSLPQIPDSSKKIKLKRNFEMQDKKTLVLDLDQTLIHSQALNVKADKSIFPLSFEYDKVTRHFAVRNYAKQFIKNLASKFYLVVFTSAVQGYADKVIEYLDPQEKYIQHRLYRNNCYCHGLTYPHMKDLRMLNRDLSQVIMVDNSFFTFWFNIDNGVPILPFKGVQDKQLVLLEKYLLTLEHVDDVREVNRRAFHMHLFKELDDVQEIIKKYRKLLSREVESSGKRKTFEVIDID